MAGDSYVEREQRLAFTALRSAPLTELLAASQQMPRTAWLRHVRAWAQASTRSHRRDPRPIRLRASACVDEVASLIFLKALKRHGASGRVVVAMSPGRSAGVLAV